jgi:hypothetical protein
MTPWLGSPTSYASGYISAQRTVASPPQSQSLAVEFSSPPTYWMGLPTCSSNGSSAAHTEAPRVLVDGIRPV